MPTYAIEDRHVCQNCFIKFNELDEHHTMVERIQTELLLLYNNTVSTTLDIKHSIKMENFEITEVDIPEDDTNFTSEPEYSEELERTPRKARKRKKSDKMRRKRGPYKKVDDETEKGYTVVEIDGEKHYKCDICHKVLQRRIKNHRETHTNERNIKCEVCGAM
jgi:DNA-directed RNA polymerase subunit RPC12/RpoP